MVSMAPAASPSTEQTAISEEVSLREPGGKTIAPKAAPIAVRIVMLSHMSMMVLNRMPWAFMLPEELMLSGKLLMKTPMTKGNAAAAARSERPSGSPAAAWFIRIPITKDSGTPSMRMPNQIMIARFLASWGSTWLLSTAASLHTPVSKSSFLTSMSWPENRDDLELERSLFLAMRSSSCSSSSWSVTWIIGIVGWRSNLMPWCACTSAWSAEFSSQPRPCPRILSSSRFCSSDSSKWKSVPSVIELETVRLCFLRQS
mmetsp:Transcript_45338/g.96867  ORF Transcript_45338/g.96867 Transcript_45338/m.96867 type:complete len:258 (+) Transcript_45338:201-974(+)